MQKVRTVQPLHPRRSCLHVLCFGRGCTLNYNHLLHCRCSWVGHDHLQKRYLTTQNVDHYGYVFRSVLVRVHALMLCLWHSEPSRSRIVLETVIFTLPRLSLHCVTYRFAPSDCTLEVVLVLQRRKIRRISDLLKVLLILPYFCV